MLRLLSMAAVIAGQFTVAAAEDTGAAPDAPPAVVAPDLGGWTFAAGGALAVDAGLVMALPAALPTGLATGAGVGVSHGRGLTLGARFAWVATTESSRIWTVTHHDVHVAVTGGFERRAGRGTVGLRLGLGGVVVREHRLRNQGKRAGLTGSDLETTALTLLPEAQLDGVVALHLFGPWSVQVGGGPSLREVAGAVHPGWSAELEVAWRP